MTYTEGILYVILIVIAAVLIIRLVCFWMDRAKNTDLPFVIALVTIPVACIAVIIISSKANLVQHFIHFLMSALKVPR